VYSLTIGPITYAIISETSAVQVRAKTVVLARNVYNIVSVASLVLEPYMMNPTSWNWQGKTAFFWSGSAFLTAVWTYFRLPKCKVSRPSASCLFDTPSLRSQLTVSLRCLGPGRRGARPALCQRGPGTEVHFNHSRYIPRSRALILGKLDEIKEES
jgi:hypothetical protein